MDVKTLKELSKEEFLKLTGATEELYEELQNSLEGEITITKISDNDGYLRKGQSHWGYTYAFAEGLSLRLYGNYCNYYTSNIQKIDWENNEFTTLNSKYKFNFKQNGKDL